MYPDNQDFLQLYTFIFRLALTQTLDMTGNEEHADIRSMTFTGADVPASKTTIDTFRKP